MAIAILFIFLNLNPTQGRTLKQHAREFDFIGLGLMIGGVVCLLIGFNASETDCTCQLCIIWEGYLITFIGSSAETIALLTVGCVLLISAAINELFTKRSPIVPPRLFQVTNAPIPCHPFRSLLSFPLFPDSYNGGASRLCVPPCHSIFQRCEFSESPRLL